MDSNRKIKLVDHASDCLMLILQLRGATGSIGDPDALRQKITSFLDTFERRSKKDGYSINDIQQAKFALVAFFDETLIASDWRQKENWLSNPLQLQLYNRFDAGDEFFQNLNELRQRGAEAIHILEIYYMCLTLGFKGRYALMEREKLRLFIDETYRDIKRARGKTSLTLSPNGKRKEDIAEVIKKEVPVWVFAVGAAALGFIFYLAVILFSTSDAHRAVHYLNGLF
jgi:type VI secretion system protein ImpK